jgi:large subunit ribosomal protein L25
VNQLRRDGLVPGVVYGNNVPTESVQLERVQLDKAIRHGALTHLVTLDLGKGKQYAVLVRELQRHAVRRNPMHVDFYRVSMTEEIEIDVPVRVTGALASGLAGDYVLIHNLETVRVSCLPGHIPEYVTVDISGLSADNHLLHVRDLVIPANVTLDVDGDETVVSLSRTRAAASEEGETEAPTAAEPEVVSKGKAARGEEAAGED